MPSNKTIKKIETIIIVSNKINLIVAHSKIHYQCMKKVNVLCGEFNISASHFNFIYPFNRFFFIFYYSISFFFLLFCWFYLYKLFKLMSLQSLNCFVRIVYLLQIRNRLKRHNGIGKFYWIISKQTNAQIEKNENSFTKIPHPFEMDSSQKPTWNQSDKHEWGNRLNIWMDEWNFNPWNAFHGFSTNKY